MAVYLITIGNQLKKVNADKDNLNNYLGETSSEGDVGLYREMEFIDRLSEDEKLQYLMDNIPSERVISLLREKCYNLIDEYNSGL